MVGGGIWAVVHRELSVGARRPFTHWLRAAGALGGVAVLCVSAWNAPFNTVGTQIFVGIHRLLMLLILCVVPAITADCIARERREGTLGLLFLTPLKAPEIVLGKVASQVLKALTLWLAVVPVLAIPFLAGGVSWLFVIQHLVAEVCVGILCLAAGIMATSLTEKRASAFALTFAFAGLLVFNVTDERWSDLLSLRGQQQVVVTRTITGSTTTFVSVNGGVWYPAPVPSQRGLARGLPFGVAPGAFPFLPPGIRARGPFPSHRPLLQELAFAWLILLCVIWFAGYCIERSWKDKTSSLRAARWNKLCSAPVLFKRAMERRLRRTLERNPIEWMQQYSWKSRVIKWGLCLVFTLLVCIASVPGDFYWIAQRESIDLAILAAAYTYAGVNGFFQEKKTGALELILVTPLTANEIIFGRVWGLWKQFIPAAFVLAVCYHTVRWLDPFRRGDIVNFDRLRYFAERYGMDSWVTHFVTNKALNEFVILAGFFALPFYATHAALRVKNIVLAAACTWVPLLVATLADVLFGLASALVLDVEPGPGWRCAGVIAAHAGFVVAAVRGLRARLARRNC